MNEEQKQQGTGTSGDFEEQLRELLAEDANTIRPAPGPYPAIRRRGTVERRRRVAATGAALVTLAAMPVGAYALADGDAGGNTVASTPPVSATPRTSATPTPTPSASPARPARPATEDQLLDGITFGQAVDGLKKCLAYDQSHTRGPADFSTDLGAAEEYRIILAMKSTGDSNVIGDGMYVVAVKEQPKQTRLICNVKDGEANGLNASVGSDDVPGAGPVMADINGGKLYQQSVLDRGNWKLPFRWGVIGTVEPSVARVTVSYGGAASQAALDHGWFVVSGVLNQQVTAAPRIKGYDADSKLVYDSDKDKNYEKRLP
ncbi:MULTISPECIES: hypothetical protein [unclassified Streptomyces]|uniref:hypothetical protein n=1 Tax=unclassified Streptomyces TaxID=2593676 RepID=UPI00225181B5|nr:MULTISPECIES: hypothetical protein [unclassified Streptomyces]MCX4787333.1 hypothetical protein [Streptomyces sp. NBC_01221]MCX4796882.1 hypothetical protein [Streptomyces sp. NBC_01242]WSJ38095.1 hypothetical protein OG772_20195 [Streptomyces sp. NBC_01321]WSP64494.1 hypothetical protein OG466_23390 [Streptomyces sp. NBC_01240]